MFVLCDNVVINDKSYDLNLLGYLDMGNRSYKVKMNVNYWKETLVETIQGKFGNFTIFYSKK